MSIKCPRVACIHEAKHDVSLVFDYALKLEDFDMLVILHNRLHDCFCIAHHDPAAILKKHSKKDNNDVLLSFIKIADTRMGNNSISLIRLLRLRSPLVTIIHSNKFLKLNV